MNFQNSTEVLLHVLSRIAKLLRVSVGVVLSPKASAAMTLVTLVIAVAAASFVSSHPVVVLPIEGVPYVCISINP